MCFSPEASFVVGGALLPAGGYCIAAALRRNRLFLPLGFVPIALGIQQIAEGFVWLGLYRGDAAQTRAASLMFLFFALAFWPFWWPCIAAVMDPRPGFRRLFLAITLLATGWFWVLFFPLALGPDSLLETEVVHHSIHYSYSRLAVYDYVPRFVLRLLYLLCAIVPMASGQRSFGRLPALMFLAATIAAAVAFEYAFVSVWCFFAAVLSAYLCVIFRNMPRLDVPVADAFGSPKTS
ncbi:MAG TPA: DUF6629 family protein [Gemmataceae bacterium]|jgi:hypothetical protein